MNTYELTYGANATPCKRMVNASQPRATIVFEMDDGTELHCILQDNQLEVRSSGSHSGRIVVRPNVTNEITVSVEER